MAGLKLAGFVTGWLLIALVIVLDRFEPCGFFLLDPDCGGSRLLLLLAGVAILVLSVLPMGGKRRGRR